MASWYVFSLPLPGSAFEPASGRVLEKRTINMPEQEKTGRAVKAEGALDPSKQGQEAKGTAAEVGGRSAVVHVFCPHCNDARTVVLDYEGQLFVCGYCGGSYQVFV